MTRGRRATVERYLTEEELDDAIRTAKRDDDAHLVQRLCFVKNCYAGDTATEAARRVGASRSTGSRWVERWNQAGIPGLRPDFGGGRPPKLDEREQRALRERLAADGPWTTAEVRSLVHEEFDADYSPGYLPRLLRSLGLSYRYDGGERSDGRIPLVGFFEE